MNKVVVVGSANIDLIMRSQELPRVGETRWDGVFSSALGGKGANQAIAAQRAGADVIFIARVGNDEYGRSMITACRQAGVETRYIASDPDLPTGIAMIGIDHRGRNTIVVSPGANAGLLPGDIEQAAAEFHNADTILLQLEVPAESVAAAIRLAASCGRQVLLNPAPAVELEDSLYKDLHVIIPNEVEAEMLSGISVADPPGLAGAAAFFLDKGVRNVVITLGERGVYVADRKGSDLVSSYKILPLDTTGAGDVFCGFLAKALAKNRTITEAVHWANAGAALSTTRLGAIPSIPDWQQVEDFLRSKPEMNHSQGAY